MDGDLPGHLWFLIRSVSIEPSQPLLDVDIFTMPACVGVVAVFIVFLYAQDYKGQNVIDPGNQWSPFSVKLKAAVKLVYPAWVCPLVLPWCHPHPHPP